MQPLVRGVADELLAAHRRAGRAERPQDGLQGRIRVRAYDVAAYKCAADELLSAAGVQLLFHAWAAGVARAGDDRIDAVLVETQVGPPCRARARVHRRLGRCRRRPLRRRALRLGRRCRQRAVPEHDVPHRPRRRAERALAGDRQLRRHRRADGARGRPLRFPRRGAILRPQRNASEWRANVTQLRNADGRAVDATDARQLSAAEIEGRRQIVEYMRFLRAEVPGFEPPRSPRSRAQVGVRETRRVDGAYMLSGDDVLSGARFEDVHRPERLAGRAAPGRAHRMGLPARRRQQLQPIALAHAGAAVAWPNLLVAGRCAGMEHLGQSAARASGACFVMGQAARRSLLGVR